MIDVSAATFRYEDMAMSFTLKVPRDAITAIIGPSGAGKSTLLSLIAGFEQPISGKIAIAGRDMTGIAPAERPVSMIFQDHNTFAHLSVFDNVALGISPSLRFNADERKRVEDALALVDLTSFAKRKPGELSGGERQRIAIARALVRNKPVLLLDEPFAALGPALRREMLDVLIALQVRRGLTVVMVSHQPEDALYAASHTAFIARGQVLAMGETRAMLEKPALAEIREYLGT
jgi:thiamine transport system ATP-binding protein